MEEVEPIRSISIADLEDLQRGFPLRSINKKEER
jgi:hypothetical protein